MKKRNKRVKEGLVFKPFIQGPDSVIHPQDEEKTAHWPERWGRRCGNPLYEKKPVKDRKE